jgi:hypothetical protein
MLCRVPSRLVPGSIVKLVSVAHNLHAKVTSDRDAIPPVLGVSTRIDLFFLKGYQGEDLRIKVITRQSGAVSIVPLTSPPKV